MYDQQTIQARSQPSVNGGRVNRFPQILDHFQDLKIGIPSSCPWETSIFKIMIADVTLWSKVESTW